MTALTGLTQDTMLVFDLNELEIRHDVQDDMVRDPLPGGKIRPENLCHLGFTSGGSVQEVCKCCS